MLYTDRLDGRVTVEQWGRFNEDLLASNAALAADIEREERALLGEGSGTAADIARVLVLLCHKASEPVPIPAAGGAVREARRQAPGLHRPPRGDRSRVMSRASRRGSPAG